MFFRSFRAVGRFSLLVLLMSVVSGCDKAGLSPEKKGPSFRFAPITRTDIVRTVEATGTITPRNTKSGIPVGAQVNGKVIKLFVDYNSVVTNGQVVALIDPLVYEANYKSAVAQLHVNQANVAVRTASLKSAEAAKTLAEKTLSRKAALRKAALCSQADLDAAQETFDRASAVNVTTCPTWMFPTSASGTVASTHTVLRSSAIVSTGTALYDETTVSPSSTLRAMTMPSTGERIVQ